MNLREYFALTREVYFIPWLTRIGKMARAGDFEKGPVYVDTSMILRIIRHITRIERKEWSSLDMNASSLYREVLFDEVAKSKEYITADKYEVFWHKDEEESLFKQVLPVDRDQTLNEALKLLPANAHLDAVVREIAAVVGIKQFKKGRVAAEQKQEEKYKIKYSYEIFLFSDASRRMPTE